MKNPLPGDHKAAEASSSATTSSTGISDETREAVARRAYELYMESGCQGSDTEHWLQAEREVLGLASHAPSHFMHISECADDESTEPGA